MEKAAQRSFRTIHRGKAGEIQRKMQEKHDCYFNRRHIHLRTFSMLLGTIRAIYFSLSSVHRAGMIGTRKKLAKRTTIKFQHLERKLQKFSDILVFFNFKQQQEKHRIMSFQKNNSSYGRIFNHCYLLHNLRYDFGYNWFRRCVFSTRCEEYIHLSRHLTVALMIICGNINLIFFHHLTNAAKVSLGTPEYKNLYTHS